jgi:hypothetical protein
MKKKRIIQPILWTEQPTGAVMGAGSLWPTLRASPSVLSMWLQTIKFIPKMSKCDGLAQGIGFSAPNSCSLPCVVKSTTRLCTSKKEYNKLERTASQCFSLVDHNDWSRWFAISSPHVYAVSVTVLLVVLQKKHRHLISLSRVTYRAPVEMLLVHSR